MRNFYIFLTISILFDYSLEIVPIWDITSSAINLLSSTSEHTYYVVDREMYGMKVKLKKKITKSGNEITHKNYLIVDENSENQVFFENIESFYHLNGIDIICPKGTNQLYDATNKLNMTPSGFEGQGNWDLKCYKHDTNYLLAYYLMNGEKQFYYCPSQYDSKAFNWRNKKFCDHLFSFIYL